MASTSRTYTADEVLAQLQDIESDESGNEQHNDSSDNDVVATEDSSSSSSTETSSEDAGVDCLQKRLRLADDAAILQPITQSRRARAGRRGAGRGRTLAKVVHDDDVQVATTAEILPGKNGTKWSEITQPKVSGPRQMQNVTRLTPGPKRYAMERIHSAKAALQLMLDVTLITWIVNFTQMEAER